MNNTTLINFWFVNEQYWFNSTNEFDHIVLDTFENYIPQTSLETILYNDQFQRHICRAKGIAYDMKYLDIAVNETFILIDHLKQYTPKEQIFIATTSYS